MATVWRYVREAIVRRLAATADDLQRRGHEVVAAVADADALLAAVAEHRPDIAVVDVRMPPTHTDDGLRAALALRRDHPDMAVLVPSQYIKTRYATQLLSGRCDGIGYLLKDRVADVGDFLDALTRVAGGATVERPGELGHSIVEQPLDVAGRRIQE